MRSGCISKNGLSRSEFNETLEQRFSAKCGSQNSNGCIPWLGYKIQSGYGLLQTASTGSKKTTAHRIAWVLANGDLEAGILVLHKCDNPGCVNPDHLFLGSQQDNVTDMVSKNRHSWRERTPWQKLDMGDIKTVYDLRHAGHTQQEVADKLGVSRPLISLIESGKIQHAARLIA